jgi:hypothetical protein
MATHNPLHKYRSNQYHFIIVATTDKAGALADIDSNTSDLSRWMHPEDRTKRYDARKIKEVKDGNEQEVDPPYVVIYNSMTDVEFFINNLVIKQTFIDAGQSGNSNPITIPQTFNFTIIEPYTIDFTTALQMAANSLSVATKTTPQNIQNLHLGLKIVFVGQLDSYHNNAPTIIASTNIFPFYLSSMDLSLSSKGAVYTVKCVPLQQAVAQSGFCSEVGGGSILLSENLSAAVSDFEAELNRRATEQDTSTHKGEKYEYQILLDAEYTDAKYKLDLISDDQRVHPAGIQPPTNQTTNDTTTQNNTEAANNTQQTDNKSKTNTPEDNKAPNYKGINFTTSKGDKIADVLYNMITLSKVVCDDIVKDNNTGSKSKYYRPVVETTMQYSNEKKTNVLIYHIIRQEMPSDVDAPDANMADIENDNVISFPLQYDYIYTGKNVDVLKFDLSVNMNFSNVGMAPSTVVVPSSNNTPESNTAANNAATNPAENNGDSMTTGAHHNTEYVKYNTNNTSTAKTPAGTADKQNTGIGSMNPSMLAAARKKLTNAIGLITQTVFHIDIVGNPILLGGFIPPADKYGAKGKINTIAEVRASIDAHTKKTGCNMLQLPTVKVNVRVPKPSYMQGADNTGDGSYYSTPFWVTDGGYFIKNITHTFNNGQFTQSLELVSMANNGVVSNDESTKNASNAAATAPPTTAAPAPSATTNDLVDSNLNPNLPQQPILMDTTGNDGQIPPLTELAKDAAVEPQQPTSPRI